MVIRLLGFLSLLEEGSREFGIAAEDYTCWLASSMHVDAVNRGLRCPEIVGDVHFGLEMSWMEPVLASWAW